MQCISTFGKLSSHAKEIGVTEGDSIDEGGPPLSGTQLERHPFNNITEEID
jgi:hypothetical protein